MPENIQEEAVVTDEILEPEPGPTPEEQEEWERQRKEEWEKKIAPFRALHDRLQTHEEAIEQHDELLSDALFEISMLEMEE